MPPDGFRPGNGTESEDTTASTQTDTTSTKGFKAVTALTVGNGTFELDCADDAFHSNGDVTVSGGSIQISTGDDALHADGNLVVDGGTIEIITCYEGAGRADGYHQRWSD